MQPEQSGKSLGPEGLVCFDFHSGVSGEIWKLSEKSCDEVWSHTKVMFIGLGSIDYSSSSNFWDRFLNP
jgi:hypothetical protein